MPTRSPFSRRCLRLRSLPSFATIAHLKPLLHTHTHALCRILSIHAHRWQFRISKSISFFSSTKTVKATRDLLQLPDFDLIFFGFFIRSPKAFTGRACVRPDKHRTTKRDDTGKFVAKATKNYSQWKWAFSPHLLLRFVSDVRSVRMRSHVTQRHSRQIMNENWKTSRSVRSVFALMRKSNVVRVCVCVCEWVNVLPSENLVYVKTLALYKYL